MNVAVLQARAIKFRVEDVQGAATPLGQVAKILSQIEEGTKVSAAQQVFLGWRNLIALQRLASGEITFFTYIPLAEQEQKLRLTGITYPSHYAAVFSPPTPHHEPSSSKDTSMRTNYVLIDFENVQPNCLNGLKHDHFKVIVFVGANQTKVPLDVVFALQQMGSRAEYVRIAGNGPNALDFHIAFFIGQLAAKDDTAYFHIISKDSGFDPLIQYLRDKKIPADRLPCISEIPILKAAPGSPTITLAEPPKQPVAKAPVPPTPENKAASCKTPQEIFQLFVTKLKMPKATRPRTVKTLSSAINAQFQKQLPEADVADIIAAMKAKKFITVADNKVTYNF